MTRIRRVGVVIPVHNEHERLGACLDAVDAAVAAIGGRCRVDVVVVLDACTDGSERVAARYAVELVRIHARRVGEARRAGITRLTGRGDDGLWIANTDADSVVPQDWLAHQLDLADAGNDVVLGSVRPDFDGLTAAHIAYWHATHPEGQPTGNTHGANLGIRGRVYAALGGFPAIAEHEDVQLVDRARAAGATIIATARAMVVTSARRDGRTPGGYAAHVRRVAADIERSLT